MTQTFPGVAYAAQQFVALLANLDKYADGFTINSDFTETPTEGICVALKGTQNNFGPVGALKSFAFAVEHSLHFGGWLDPQTDKFYFDAVRLFPETDLVAALEFAKEQEQLSVFRLSDFTTFNLGANVPNDGRHVIVGFKPVTTIFQQVATFWGGLYQFESDKNRVSPEYILYWREKEVVETPTLTLPYHEDADE